MTDPGPYEVVYAGPVRDEIETLPAVAKRALREVLVAVAADPWAQLLYHPRHPEEMRTVAYGDWGVLVYVISEKSRRVIVAHVTWAG